MKKVGNFEAEVSGPYPAWVTIKHGSAELRLHHGELRDLLYLTNHLRREAKRKLGDRKGEA